MRSPERLHSVLDRHMLLPFGVDPSEVSLGPFEGFVQDLLGSADPGDDARVLARVAMRRWRATGDHRWLLQIVAIGARLDLVDLPHELHGSLQSRRGRPSVDRYREWCKVWLVQQASRGREPHSGVLRGETRNSAKRGLATATRRAATAETEYQRSRWELRAREYRSRLLADALARYELGREAADGRSRKAAGRAREAALALGWKEPT